MTALLVSGLVLVWLAGLGLLYRSALAIDRRAELRTRALLETLESLERVHDAQREAWARAFPSPPAYTEPAQVEAPPDPDRRALDRFSEATIERGVKSLMELGTIYGTSMTAEQARVEAERLLRQGAGPLEPL